MEEEIVCYRWKDLADQQFSLQDLFQGDRECDQAEVQPGTRLLIQYAVERE